MLKSILKISLGAFILMAGLSLSVRAEVIQALHDALPQEYKTNGIKAAFFNDWAPDEFVDADGQLKGWSVDLAKQIEERLGVPFAFEATSFDIIIPGIQSKRFDVGFASFGVTLERLKTLDFVSQRLIGTAFSYLTSSNLDIKTPADSCGLTVAVLNGAWDIGLIEQINKENCQDNPLILQLHSSQAQAELAVRSKRADVLIAASPKLAYMAQQTGYMSVSDLVLASVNSSIGLRKGDPLGPIFRDAIQSMIEDGSYKLIMEKWGIADSGMLTKGLLITEENPADL